MNKGPNNKRRNLVNNSSLNKPYILRYLNDQNRRGQEIIDEVEPNKGEVQKSTDTSEKNNDDKSKNEKEEQEQEQVIIIDQKQINSDPFKEDSEIKKSSTIKENKNNPNFKENKSSNTISANPPCQNNNECPNITLRRFNERQNMELENEEEKVNNKVNEKSYIEETKFIFVGRVDRVSPQIGKENDSHDKDDLPQNDRKLTGSLKKEENENEVSKKNNVKKTQLSNDNNVEITNRSDYERSKKGREDDERNGEQSPENEQFMEIEEKNCPGNSSDDSINCDMGNITSNGD